ncbi:MAG TPA: alpha/beta fold hydrolase [Pyrinomonadaceae bacterium]|nr:alpha/beta fold hydrolase [Pyrinomonadaceae bacterium]
MIADFTDARDEKHAPSLLAQVTAKFQEKPFVPARFFTQGDMQTLAAFFWPGRFRPRDVTEDEERLFEVEPGSQVLARCRWQPDRTQHPTLVLWHGLEGSAASAYMLTTAAKIFQRGFNVVRMNIRNCGGTEHLTPTLYHGGLTHDLRAVVVELINQDLLPRIVIAGFSLGGNLTLKLAGEWGGEVPEQLKGVVAISPSVDLQASSDLLKQPRNFVYHRNFLYYLKRRITLKQQKYPELYDSSALGGISSLVQFDDHYVAPAFDFADARDYYAKASALPFLSRIRVPTLIIHAQDDPFIPFTPLEKALLPLPARGEGTEGWGCDAPNLSPNPSPQAERGNDLLLTTNPSILLVAPPRGGHVAFVGADSLDEDRFWAENRLVDFSEIVAGR